MHESIIAIREILGVLADLLIIIAVFGCNPLSFDLFFSNFILVLDLSLSVRKESYPTTPNS